MIREFAQTVFVMNIDEKVDSHQISPWVSASVYMTAFQCLVILILLLFFTQTFESRRSEFCCIFHHFSMLNVSPCLLIEYC